MLHYTVKSIRESNTDTIKRRITNFVELSYNRPDLKCNIDLIPITILCPSSYV